MHGTQHWQVGPGGSKHPGACRLQVGPGSSKHPGACGLQAAILLPTTLTWWRPALVRYAAASIMARVASMRLTLPGHFV
jgi:hypothetical protein